MTLVLAIDASTYVGTVAVTRDGVVLDEREVAMRGEREERLMPAVAEALRAVGLEVRDVELVACGAGPGSFTSLRIAASIAKGIALAVRSPLVALPSLVLTVAAARPAAAPGRYLSVLDAMRGEVFAADVEVGLDGCIAACTATRLVRAADIVATAASIGATAIGPGQTIDARPHARGAALLGTRWATPEPVDIPTWEPEYGRLAEAQARWEAVHGRPLAAE